MRLYVVTGMHRSGTSAVAALAEAVGADLGDPADLLPPAPDNPRGFFELRAFKALNDRILAAFGGRWDGPPRLPGGWQDDPQLDDLRQQATELLEELAARDSDVVVLKDPRAALTLPFWRSLHHIDGTVLPLRDPHGVAASLERRNDMPADRAAQLWWVYTAASLVGDPDALLLSYADVVRRPEDAAARLAAHLGLASPDRRAILDVIDPGLDHGDAAPDSDDEVLLAAERQYRRLLDDADERDRLRDVALLSTPTALPDEAASLLEEVRELQSRASDREQRLAAVNERIESLRVERQQAIASRDAERERGSQLDRKVSELQSRARDLEEQRFQAEAALAERNLQLADLDDRVRRLTKDLHEVAALRKDVARQLRRTREELRRLRNRKGVRVALKLASLAKPFMPSRPDQPKPTADTDVVAQPVIAEPDAETAVAPPEQPAALAFDPTRAPMATDVTVVVPIHDSPDEVRRCLDALVRNTTSPARLLLIDDASKLPETREVLDEYEQLEAVTVLRNDENLGFTRSVNRGLEACETDVVILNSDTEVAPRWLQGLRIAAYSKDDVGTATAVSDDAGAFSVPVMAERNQVPAWLGVDAAGRAMARGSEWILPATPTGNGFCMYIRRAMLDAVGLLDAEAFPVGYGEENDLCMRAGREGWKHVVADAVYVRHLKGSSFGSRREQLMASGRQALDERYPEYTQMVRAFVGSDEMHRVRDLAHAALWDRAASTTSSGGPRLLYVLHEGRGGAPATSVDLGVELSDRYDSLMLTSDTRTIRLRALTADGPVLLEEHPLDEPIRFADHRREDVRRLLADIMVRHGVELVHIRHIVKTTLDVFDVANDLDIPYVVSFHDYYMSCPTVHLLDDNDQFCGGLCTPGDGRCRIPMDWIAETAPHLKHAGVHEWRDLMRPRLERAAALITTSETARSVYLRSYPSLDPARFHVIEHGRDLDLTPVGWNPPTPGDRIRILIPGNLDVHKGSDLLRGMLELDTDRRLELHQLGDVDDSTELLATAHGTYERDEFPDRVREIAPHLIGIFSITAETYNHSLSEAWMTGVPVVATDLGALGERIRAHGGGFLVPHDDPAEALRRILHVADDPGGLAALSGVPPTAVRAIPAMGEDYDVVYRNAIAERRALAPVPPVRIGLVVLGSRSEAPGSVHVRSLRPLSHPALHGDITVRLMTPAALRAGTAGIDLAIVQRTAIPPGEVAATIRALEEGAVPLVVEVDDLLFDAELLPEGDRDWSVDVPAVGELMRAAELVSVSTDVIAERAKKLNPNVAMIANHLDERLWFHDDTDVAVDDDGTAPLRLLYMGSKTHDADLQLLEPVLDELRDRFDRPVEFDVIGGSSRDAEWFNKVRVPSNTANYPAFARWLATVAPGHRIALAPLVDTPFTRAKSDLKWLEYSALGLPGVFSNVPAYAGSVTDGETGLLVDNEPGAWTAAIERLATDDDLATAIVTNARAEIVARRILDRRVRERLGVYSEALRRSSPESARRPIA